MRLDLAYDGTAFSGWAAQPALRTVAGRAGGGPHDGAAQPRARARSPSPGRTDAGVHARGQVAHVDLDPRPGRACPGARTASPGPPSSPGSAASCPTTSSCAAPRRPRRASTPGSRPSSGATSTGSPTRTPSVTRCGATTRSGGAGPSTSEAMDAAARSLVGLRDFAAFCKQREGATTIRTLLDFSWIRLADGVLAATVRADAFCHSMVRSLVGAVVPVGEGRRSRDWPRGAAGPRRAGRRDPRHAAARPQPRGGRLPRDDALAARAVTTRGRADDDRLPASRDRDPTGHRADACGWIERMKARPTRVLSVGLLTCALVLTGCSKAADRGPAVLPERGSVVVHAGALRAHSRGDDGRGRRGEGPLGRLHRRAAGGLDRGHRQGRAASPTSTSCCCRRRRSAPSPTTSS